MTNFSSEFLVVLNPWQTMMPSILYSIAPDISRIPILEYDPYVLDGYFKLKSLSTEIKDSTNYIEDFFENNISELLHKLEIRTKYFEHSYFDSIDALVRFHPRKLLVLANILPPDSFWQRVSEDTEVHILVFEQTREDIEQLCNSSVAFSKYKEKVFWLSSSPVDQLIKLWELIRATPFPDEMEAILAGDDPLELATGLYHARKEDIPLISTKILMVGGDQESIIRKVKIKKGEGSDNNKQYEIEDLAHYSPQYHIQLADNPQFICLLEDKVNLGFFSTLVYALEKSGLILISPTVSPEKIEAANRYLQTISDLIFAGKNNQAEREYNNLKILVTSQIPENLQIIINNHPKLPIQIVGTPFPYSLCEDKVKKKVWATSRCVSFIPLNQATKIYLKTSQKNNLDEIKRETNLVAFIDTLSGQGQTETDFARRNIESFGAYCISLNKSKATSAATKSIFNYLPVDICLFVTHGNKDGILLNDSILSAEEIRSLGLSGNPFVINNSCLSWIGVGNAFIESRARGYIGTYWTIENNLAIDIAKDLIIQMLKGDTASNSVRNIIQRNPNSLTNLAYLFVGLYDAKLPIRTVENLTEARGLMLLKILKNIGNVALHIEDIQSSITLNEIINSPENIIRDEIPLHLSGEIDAALFEFKLGVSRLSGKIDIDQIIVQGEKAVGKLQVDSINQNELYRTLSHLGGAYLERHENRDVENSEKCFLKALEIERNLGHRASQARELGNLGLVRMYQNDYRNAIEYHKQALSINKEIGNAHDQVLDCQNLARCYLESDDITTSLQYAKDAFDIHDRIAELRLPKLQFCVSLAEDLLKKGYHQAASKYLDITQQDLFNKLQENNNLSQTEASLLIHCLYIRGNCHIYKHDFDSTLQTLDIASQVAISFGLLKEAFRSDIRRFEILVGLNDYKRAVNVGLEIMSRKHIYLNEIDISAFQALEERMGQLTNEQR